jgi:hypothetical protein
MTDRHAGYLVTLTEDLRDDDAEEILAALRMVRGVQSVEPVVANIDQRIAQSRADTAWRERLINLIKEAR